MSKRNALRIINPLMAVLLLNQAITGLFHDAMPYEVFDLLHKGGWLLVGLTVLHVILNWGWIRANLLKRKSAVPPEA